MSVTLGITAYNEEKNIGKLLDMLLKEKFLFNQKEIIIVASGCTDRTPEIVEKLASENKKIKLVLEGKRNGKASAINIILKKAKGDVIVFICADNLPRINSINKIVEKFNNEPGKINLPVDHYLHSFINECGLKAFIGEPKLVSQGSINKTFNSSIWHSKLNEWNDLNALNPNYKNI